MEKKNNNKTNKTNKANTSDISDDKSKVIPRVQKKKIVPSAKDKAPVRGSKEGNTPTSSLSVFTYLHLLPSFYAVRLVGGLTFHQVALLSCVALHDVVSTNVLVRTLYGDYSGDCLRKTNFALDRLIIRGLVQRVSVGYYSLTDKGKDLLSGKTVKIVKK